MSPGKDEPEDWNDAIGMVPFADYFNHVDDAVGLSLCLCTICIRVCDIDYIQACEVNFDGKKYTFRATRRYGTLYPFHTMSAED